MAVELFPHNQQAYEAVLEMLSQAGKAAVVHPTGTGKSFIAFKLCEEFPAKRICWLAPSEYIFMTQLENLKKACNGYQPDNVQFFTYAKLMIMFPDEIEQIQPDYIILDEFHRCGAQMWGAGLKKLLEIYPNAFVLGLSATHVRYLDNQRDMAVELFNGNIASEMSLGAAIVRGILQPPKYVLSAFRYEKDFDKYRYRIDRLKSKAAKDEAEKNLEALRRALDKADGLDIVFQKHIDNSHGKYIVFCANYEHMQEMILLSHDWFSKVDSEPHVYSAYSNDLYTEKSFAEFKEDNSNHLKLLYCIDMLNEGVHVDDIDGVILLRPTVSPIIYKQQIGRALSAGTNKIPVIFDIVMNIDNLYSIGAIQEEMDDVLFLYRRNGEKWDVVHENFQIIDELCDCMELFDRLNDSLTASWELMYQEAKQYKETHGNLNVSRRYVTTDGYCLGNWLCRQRMVYSGKCAGILTAKQISLLNDIGMRWYDYTSDSWNTYYSALCEYKKEHGHLDIPVWYVTPDGLKVGKFLANLKTSKSTGRKNKYLTPDHIAALDNLGMIWSKVDYKWENYYLACAKYHLDNHHLNIPVTYISPEGLRIGQWLRRQRNLRYSRIPGTPLTDTQIQRLEEIGMIWEDVHQTAWEKAYSRAVVFYQTHGNLNVPKTYVDESGFALGSWLRRHKDRLANGKTQIKVTPERRAKLDELGMNWEE